MSGRSLRAELEELKAELARLKQAQPSAAAPAAGEVAETGGGLGAQIGELNGLVQQMLDEAEETVAEHPVATVAGALALGIVIGRLTAR
jgi:ElaB/YqjD/DUF883 family membrane-anchored ribosome-binding protein